jgi:hypothetical protein
MKIERYIQRMFKWFGLNIEKAKLRGSLQFAKENLGKDLVVVEVGVFEGENAERIIRNLGIKRIYLIDPYKYEKTDCSYTSKTDLCLAKEKMKKRLSKYGNKIIFIKRSSIKSLNSIPDNCDYIYIDGNHNYKNVKEDIKNYYNKVKDGGILAGHNIENGGYYKNNGVTQAFVEFVAKKNLKPFIANKDWWIIKGENEL